MALQKVPGRAIELGSDTEGDLAYYDGSKWTRLAKGTAGQLLATNSGATAPEWVASLPDVGTDGNVLTSNGTAWTSEAPATGGAGELVSQILFTGGTGNWTKPANVTKIRVWVIGPGGSTGHGSFCNSRGGGGGGCAMSILDVTNVTTYPYVVGMPGVAQTGVLGTTSTFNTTITASAGGNSWSDAGGDGQCTTPNVGSGGTGAGGQINIEGSTGIVIGNAAGPLGGNIGRGAPGDPDNTVGPSAYSGGSGAIFVEEYA